MLSLDANLLFYAFNADSPQHKASIQFLEKLSPREDVALSEFILCELYVLLRNPAILETPLSSRKAADVIQAYRTHPLWKIVGFPTTSKALHKELWSLAAKPNFPRRRIFDLRTALTLISFGVT